MAGLTLDAGALIAAERNDRTVWRRLAAAKREQARVTIPAGVLAQTWRGNSPRIAKLLQGCEVEVLDEDQAKVVGRALGQSKTRDVIDAAVVLGAMRRRDTVLTSDVPDLQVISDALRASVRLVGV